MNYELLLDTWSEKILSEADNALNKCEECDHNSYKYAHLKGYGEGLIMANSILSRLEKVLKNK